MEKDQKGRYSVIDVVKAIGIISIMIGHSAATLPLTHIKTGAFVYSYHIMIFFFTAGFCYDEKYNRDPALYCGKRVLGIYLPYVLYNAAFVLLHNLLCALSLTGAEPYGFRETVKHIADGFIFNTGESMLGAFWFLAVLAIASIIFILSFSISTKIADALGKGDRAANGIMAAVMAVCALAGIYLNINDINLIFHIQTAFLAAPFMFFGWAVKKNYKRIEKYLGIISLIVSAALLYVTVAVIGWRIELSVNMISKWYLFYPISAVGAVFCLSLARVIGRIKPFAAAARFIGKRTFHYMALHILVFKLLDLVIVSVKGDGAEVLSKSLHSYDLGLCYTLFAAVVISVGLYGTEKIGSAIAKKRSNEKEPLKNDTV